MENKYPKGIYFNKKHPNAPEFVIGGLAIIKKEFIEWLQNEEGERINFSIKEGKERPYIQVDTYVAKPKDEPSVPFNVAEKPEVNISDLSQADLDQIDAESIPF